MALNITLKRHQLWFCMENSPQMPFWNWLSTVCLGGTGAEWQILSQYNETVSACVYLRGETNKDNYCQRILFILCAVCLWRINMLQPEPVGLLGQSASSFMLFIIACCRALPNSYYTAGPGDPTASRTKLYISGLKPCVFWALGFKLKRNKKGGKCRGERKRRRETAAVGEYRSSSILMCANSPAPAD